MKELIEHYILTNEERKYFGLEPILPQWERHEVKEGFIVYFDGDVIRKTISVNTLLGADYEYMESDNEIYTREHNVVLPRTEKGKEKKLNFTSINGMNPTGCTFRMNIAHPYRKSSLWAGNTRNSISLPVDFPDDIKTFTEYRSWLNTFIVNIPADYFDKVKRMKNTPHRTVKYYNGDIFRFEADLEHYGFGLIIGQMRKMKKDGLLSKEHILYTTMGVALLVRLYKLKSAQKDIDIDKLTSYPLGDTFIMMDNQVIWGAYDIVGSKKLSQNDINFPIQTGKSIDARDPDYVRLCWGTGIILRRNVKDFPDSLINHKIMRNGSRIGVGKIDLERTLESKENCETNDLEKRAFQYFGVPFNMTFDEFNRQNNGLTAKEYADYANKSGRVK
ncbi:MAG: hypothetical protein GX061_06620 [Eubacteriaceae bacterium]|nr:hypothetical protein [Eubacteriaceae bacterium]